MPQVRARFLGANLGFWLSRRTSIPSTLPARAQPYTIPDAMPFSDLELSRRLERTEGNACAQYAQARRRLFPESGGGRHRRRLHLRSLQSAARALHRRPPLRPSLGSRPQGAEVEVFRFALVSTAQCAELAGNPSQMRPTRTAKSLMSAVARPTSRKALEVRHPQAVSLPTIRSRGGMPAQMGATRPMVTPAIPHQSRPSSVYLRVLRGSRFLPTPNWTVAHSSHLLP